MMPRRNMDEQFAKERHEWTRRKHDLVARYFVPAAMKMKQLGGAIAMIDGFAGPNEYGSQVAGSTAIMVEAARRVIAAGASATVYACEVDAARHVRLRSNLSKAINEGTLVTFDQAHSSIVLEIQNKIGRLPAIVFLDPQTAAEMILERDILPWAKRPKTDILGIFMGGQACRMCGAAIEDESVRYKAEKSLGAHWNSATTIEGAYEVFFAEIKGLKKYSAIYRLRKQEPKADAYGVFGLSDSPHGFWLLSEAVAKDWGALNEFDASKRKPDLFSEVDRELEEKAAFERLVNLVSPIVRDHPGLRGDKLGIAMFERGIGIEEAFGRYSSKDFTSAAKTFEKS